MSTGRGKKCVSQWRDGGKVELSQESVAEWEWIRPRGDRISNAGLWNILTPVPGLLALNWDAWTCTYYLTVAVPKARLGNYSAFGERYLLTIPKSPACSRLALDIAKAVWPHCASARQEWDVNWTHVPMLLPDELFRTCVTCTQRVNL